ncbi:hypothetical protein RRG08_047628 [Elysia crispata]|uniref:Uncharacterized protein n=1 Tax=Elysia crispata TaxID=231223 RepID=A0AAE1BEW5_9GAST|nr:hypothetical protein RRG08_047628 [Elysia crispata]
MIYNHVETGHQNKIAEQLDLLCISTGDQILPPDTHIVSVTYTNQNPNLGCPSSYRHHSSTEFDEENLGFTDSWRHLSFSTMIKQMDRRENSLVDHASPITLSQTRH